MSDTLDVSGGSQLPVGDWRTDFDILDPAYIDSPSQFWSQLREGCPVAHTDRHGGSWLPTRFDDIDAITHDVERFSSRDVSVIALPDEQAAFPQSLPPLQVDPPVHTWSRRLLLPFFSHSKVSEYEATTRELCRGLVDGLVARGHADAAIDYAQQIPVRVIANILGVPPDMADTFIVWVRDAGEFSDETRQRAASQAVASYVLQQIAERHVNPGTDLISELLRSDVDGAPISDDYILGTVFLTLLAGVDTTWSAIGSALWHLASHDDDRSRLVQNPELLPIAVEELLRAYSPVTMARIVTQDTEFNGCPMKAGDRVLLSFGAANRDPAVFPDADRVVLDRAVNRHIAFGAGIHRCAGSNLARMELRVALEEWHARIPSYRLADPAAVKWAGVQVRGPRSIPVVFP